MASSEPTPRRLFESTSACLSSALLPHRGAHDDGLPRSPGVTGGFQGQLGLEHGVFSEIAANGHDSDTNGAAEEVFPALPQDQYDIIYADPPWDYRGQLQHAGPGSGDTGGAVRHYPTVTLSHLKELPIDNIAADNSLLFLWATNPHLDQAIDLGKSWGFAWATVAFVWDKVRVNPGFYTLSQCELCLVFKRGKIPRPRGARNIRQFVSAKRGPHSVKPHEVRRRIEQMFPEQRKIELFARQKMHGWHPWGLEINGARASGG